MGCFITIIFLWCTALLQFIFEELEAFAAIDEEIGHCCSGRSGPSKQTVGLFYRQQAGKIAV
jgi:hypothetical protein